MRQMLEPIKTSLEHQWKAREKAREANAIANQNKLSTPVESAEKGAQGKC